MGKKKTKKSEPANWALTTQGLTKAQLTLGRGEKIDPKEEQEEGRIRPVRHIPKREDLIDD